MLPFVVACGAAVAGFYPYGGTRHLAFLAPFAFAGVSYPLAVLAGRRLWPVLLGIAILMPVWYAKCGRLGAGWSTTPRGVRRELMTDAMEYLRALTPAGGLVFSDIQTQYLLKRYLPTAGEIEPGRARAGYTEYWAGARRLICPAMCWRFAPAEFGDQFFRMSEVYGLGHGEPVCVASAGWGRHLAFSLSGLGICYPELRTYGNGICVFRVPVGSEVRSESLSARVELTSRVLDDLSRVVSRRLAGGPGLAAVLWPGPYPSDSARVRLHGFAPGLVPYATAYAMALSEACEFDDLLPALAFWVVGTPELHPAFTRYMDERQHYVSGAYRFTLLAADPSGLAAVYLVERP
ncbi:hypothetical protein FJY71_04395 [candidate division WOR-3 bacterium]|nr:hypothetical protein [candidate division WOR-3 bacterium]